MSAAQPRFDAIGFDVDGTLYSDPRMYLHSFWWGVRNIRLALALREAREGLRKSAPVADFHAAQARETARIIGGDPERVGRIIKERIYDDWELSLRGLPLIADLVPCLERLNAAGLRLGVLSDFPVGRKLEVLGLDRYFSCALSTEDTGCLKPHPDGFERLAGALVAEPARVLYVGNSWRYDVRGARGVGMATAHFAPRPHDPEPADFTFTSYAALADWVLGG